MSSDEAPNALEEAWLHYERAGLQRRYGVGNFVAVYEGVVIDWDRDREALRERAEKWVGDTVFVGPVPVVPPAPPGEWDMDAARRLGDLQKIRPNRRRLLLNVKRYFEIGELIGDRGCELLGGIVYIDGLDRRYAEHDYRLLVQHGLVPEETILVGGILFWKDAPTDVADTTWIVDSDTASND